MNLLRILFFPLFGIMRKKETSDTATPPPANPNRVHIFYGGFGSELEATDYCLKPMGRNKPEQLTHDLPDAMIDISEVKVIFGAARINDVVPMLSPRPDSLLGEIEANNTIIMIADAAFGGLPYTLNDTLRLTYAGAFDVS
jgi:hypothetical protein